jgi:hypothetical protein
MFCRQEVCDDKPRFDIVSWYPRKSAAFIPKEVRNKTKWDYKR